MCDNMQVYVPDNEYQLHMQRSQKRGQHTKAQADKVVHEVYYVREIQ